MLTSIQYTECFTRITHYLKGYNGSIVRLSRERNLQFRNKLMVFLKCLHIQSLYTIQIFSFQPFSKTQKTFKKYEIQINLDSVVNISSRNLKEDNESYVIRPLS